MPGPGYFQVVGDPPTASRTFTVRNFGPDGVESEVSDTFSQGQVIELEGTAFAGQRGLAVDGVKCDGLFPIVIEQVTEVVLHLDSTGCSVTTTSVHAVDG